MAAADFIALSSLGVSIIGAIVGYVSAQAAIKEKIHGLEALQATRFYALEKSQNHQYEEIMDALKEIKGRLEHMERTRIRPNPDDFGDCD